MSYYYLQWRKVKERKEEEEGGKGGSSICWLEREIC